MYDNFSVVCCMFSVMYDVGWYEQYELCQIFKQCERQTVIISLVSSHLAPQI